MSDLSETPNLSLSRVRDFYVASPRWISPLSLFTLLPLVTLVVTFFLPNYFWIDYWKTPLFLSSENWVCLIVVVLVFYIGSRDFRKRIDPVKIELSVSSFNFLKKSCNFLFWATLFIYLIWALSAVSKGLKPETFFAILRGDNSALLLSKYVYFQKISGVTTWVQFGIPAAALSALMFRIAENRKKYVVQMIALCSLSVFRTLFMAEREASIETLLAVILMLLIIRNSPQKSENIKFWQVFAVFWPGVLVVFGTFEFLRSWSSYYSGISNDFFGFLVSRLLGYYATSLNNAALANSAMSWQDNLGTLFHINLFSNNEQIAETLSTNANLEFNNVSGLLLPFGALGFFGAIALLFVVARLFLLLFTSGSKGDLSSVLAYSCSAVSILEISRFFYLGDGRYLPVLIVLVYFRYKYKRVALDQRS